MRTSSFCFALCLCACATPRGEAPAASAPAPAASPAPQSETNAQSPSDSQQQAPLIEITNARQPLPGMLTGGQPTAEQLRAAKSAGYSTVISLLPASDTADEAALAGELGLHFVTIEVRGAADITEAKARELGAALHAANAKPVLVHCASGNRVGALLALEAFYMEGASVEDALSLGDRAGLASLRPAVEQHLGAAKKPE